MDRLGQLFQQFVRERIYVTNVTVSTREWYETAWKRSSARIATRPDHRHR